jgi:hypothetical protein
MNEQRIPRSVLNMKVKKNDEKGNQDQDGNNTLGKMSYRKKGKHAEKLRRRRRSCGNTEMHGETLLSDSQHKVETS